MDAGFSGTIMCVRVADASSFYTDENILRTGIRNGNVLQFEWTARCNKADGFHVLES